MTMRFQITPISQSCLLLTMHSSHFAHIRNMGGKTDKLNTVAKETWL